MPIGRARKRARFEEKVRTPDGAGGNAVAWSEIATVWAWLAPERGRERLDGGRLESNVGAVLQVRSLSATRSVVPENRVVIDGVVWNVRSITNPDQHDRWLEMVIERGVAT